MTCIYDVLVETMAGEKTKKSDQSINQIVRILQRRNGGDIVTIEVKEK